MKGINEMTHKEMTAHIRNRIKASGIKARVKMNTCCGINYVTIAMDEKRFNGSREWTSQEAREIAFICKCNKLTGAQGSEIDLDIQEQLTGKAQFSFEYRRVV